MRPVLQNQPEIERLSNPLVQALRVMLAAITTGWNKQHNGDGAHTDVTADSVISTMVSKGRYRNHKIAFWDNATDSTGVIKGMSHITAPGVPPIPFSEAGVMVVRYATFDGGATELHAIDGVGRKTGEIVWLVHDDGGAASTGLALRLDSASAGGYTQFRGDNGAASTDTVGPNRIVPLMFVKLSDLGIQSTKSYWQVGAF